MLEIYRMDDGDTTAPRGNSSKRLIFRTTESLVTDQPDARLITYSFEADRADPENQAPFEDNSPRPDTGFRGATYTVTAMMLDINGVSRLRDWYREKSDTRQNFYNGRFGIRNTDDPELDTHPTETYGYKLVRLRIDRELKYGWRRVTITLRMAGAASGIGATAGRD